MASELALIAAAPQERPYHRMLMTLRFLIEVGDWRQTEMKGLATLLVKRDASHRPRPTGCAG